ncbi:hypothetical protein [Mesorhizobium sp. M7A.F.Ca.US.008.03.1.1]|uniref:hypothetical protein n=1 Tax=Mesorhizobium sp. M7A.F.Ca.US.008.03.1.1 TaxID=2496742 RepID=UPI000FCB31F8|nr:hypothetical protein [Mesorhizobium sp. M7A.F.Ca.US.008.03.1.1]RUW62106.1 hypothetical protein EOA16_10235 [Mesorhizobium sp. M7A.F.Ca.US.008.03.1.1]
MNALGTLKPYGMPAGMDPRTWRQEVGKRINELLDQSMALITALDLMEADCDLEDTADDEPSLGWTARGGPGDTCDLELDNADDEDGHDAEPSEDGETVQWALNPLVSQDCPAFHGN